MLTLTTSFCLLGAHMFLSRHGVSFVLGNCHSHRQHYIHLDLRDRGLWNNVNRRILGRCRDGMCLDSPWLSEPPRIAPLPC